MSLYQVCALIVVLCIVLLMVAYSIGRFLWEERKQNKMREALRQKPAQSRLKYAVYPGYVISQNDGDRHYIGAPKLMQLYGVNPRECLVIREGEYGLGSPAPINLIPLKPRFDGNYTL